MLSIEGLHMRAAFFRCIRSFFHTQGFLEVDTPLRQPVYIPESNIEPIAADGQYLHTSPELSMKRLLAHGCEKIFQLCPCFRRGERGSRHLEEFQLLEWYRTGCDYTQLMTDCQDLLRHIQDTLEQYLPPFLPQHTVLFSGMDLTPAWPRITVADAFSRYCPISLDEALRTGGFDEMLTEHVEPHLGLDVPVFLYAYPVQLAALAKKCTNNQNVAERFELYVKGVEVANGFSELTDENEQRLRFQQEIATIRKSSTRKADMPERFLQDLGKIGEAAGIALGADRLFMLAMNYPDITSAVTFAPGDFS